ncbi:hypothetical protein [Crossiella sp. NPDC003009]
MILLVVLVLAIIGGGIYAFTQYQYAHRDYGMAPRSIAPNPLCDKISGKTRELVRTTNPDRLELRKYDDGSQIAWCNLRMTKGKDGEGERFLQVELFDASASTSDRKSEDLLERLELAKRYGGNHDRLAGVGEEAYLAVKMPSGSGTTVELQLSARGPNGFVKVTYGGFDVGTFSKRQPNLDDLKASATAVAQDALR